MARKAKEIIWPHLNDCNKDVTKKWYVEYSVTNPLTGKKERNRLYEGFDQYSTVDEKRKFAQKIIDEYTDKLKSGWRPFNFDAIREFDDELTYHNASTFVGKRKKQASFIQPLFSEFLNYKRAEINKSSYDDYKSKLRQFSQYLEKEAILNKDLSFYNSKVICDFLRMMSEEKYRSRKTILKYQQIIFSFFNYLKKQKRINIPNPIDDNIPRFGKIVDQSPAGIPEQIRVLLRRRIEEEDEQLWMACCFIYYTAIRPGTELRLMKFKQINFQAHTITVTNELAKNNRTETIDIPDHLYELMTKKWKLQYYESEMYVFGKNRMPGYEHLGENTMRERFNKIRDELKLSKDIKFYSWKHSGAQELANTGVNTYELQRHLRHRELATTEYYLRKRIGQKSSHIKHNFPEIG